MPHRFANRPSGRRSPMRAFSKMDSLMMRRCCRQLSHILIFCLVVLIAESLWISIIGAQVASSADVFLLEDFSKAEADGFPQGWHASRSETITRQAYQIQQDGTQTFLRCKGVDSNARIFKRVAWDPKGFPIISWRW